MSIGSMLSIARSAIQAHQTAAEVVSQNIANSETEGYSRQRAEILPGPSTEFTFGTLGTGVTVENIRRLRNGALDINYRLQTGKSEGANVRADLLSQVEGIFGEPSDAAMAASLDAFWSSWSDLANNPGNATAQSAVRQRGSQVASLFNTYANQLTDVENGTRSQLSNTIDQANALMQRMAQLNHDITAAEADNRQAPDLRDARDLVSDQLANLLGARTVPQSNGTYAVVVAGTTIVDAANVRSLALQPGNPTSIAVASTGSQLRFVGGSAGSMLGVLNTDIASLRSKLDTMARAVVNGVNFLHMSGWTAAGDALGRSNWTPPAPTGSRIEFFDPTNTTAASMSLSTDVTANAAVIAAGTTQNGPGDNGLALSIAALRDDNGMAALEASVGPTYGTLIGLASGTTYGEYYRDAATTLGLDVAAASSDASALGTLATQAQNRRSSVMGVSIDEELTLMMRHQQAFIAASRLVQAADEMAQTVLQMV
jgi:flagellar hook-associated protein 1